MADMLSDGATMLAASLKASVSKTVTYRRRSWSVSLSATIGRTTFEQTDAEGIVSSFESRDFIVTAADLILSGETTTPQRGDTIEETAGGILYVYELLPTAFEKTWRYSDPHRTMIRIHTKLVSQES